jgi:hypothetical protein
MKMILNEGTGRALRLSFFPKQVHGGCRRRGHDATESLPISNLLSMTLNLHYVYAAGAMMMGSSAYYYYYVALG